MRHGVPGSRRWRHRSVIAVVAAVGGVLIAMVALRILAAVLVDYWWFDSLGCGSVYGRILLARVVLWCVGFAASFGAAASGFLIARRIARSSDRGRPQWGRRASPFAPLQQMAWPLCWAGAAFAGVVGGSMLSLMWHRVLLFLYRMPFDVADPIFGKDIGFFVLVYPLAVLLRRMLLALVWVSLAGAAAWHTASGAFLGGRDGLPAGVFSHLSRTLGVAFLLVAAGHLLDRYGLLYSTAGAAFGAGYTDVHVRLPGHWLMAAAALVAAVLLLRARSVRDLRSVLIGLGAWLGCVVLAEGLLPPLVQSLRVTPNELRLEEPYIRHAIDFTRRAYALDAIEEIEYPVVDDLRYEDVAADRATVDNVRVWDWRPLRETFRHLQTIRSYYEFLDVDVGRYETEGGTTQMLLSVREIAPDRLQASAQSWVNLRLKYTHGHGVCMSPANAFTEDGFPVLTVRDIPPVTPESIPLDRPEVYYGEATNGYVFVRTNEDEFDYPMGDENAWTRYEGSGGVPVGTFRRRLAFAVELRDPKILLSTDLTSESRILYRRQVVERVRRLVPYLTLDRDPYPVVHAGRIFWIQDAYTATRLYPYSEPAAGGRLNYVRNSVKAVVDAYEGTVTLYVADGSDPLVRAYARMFPGLYRPLEEMPEGLRRHVRYPVDLFEIQAEKYNVYHMRSPQVFYTREDIWEVAQEKYHGQRQMVESYYAVMRLPDSERPEFLVMLPMTPRGRANMIAWLGGRCDGEHYGKLVVCVFPKGKLVDGPLQVENYIDQDPLISGQVTLWNQSGSSVLRGNLLVIPIAGGLLYVEPLYIRADAEAIPQIKRVIVAAGSRVAMAETLQEALRQLFEVSGPPDLPARDGPASPPGRDAPAVSAAVAEAVRAANAEYGAAQRALQEADWQRYGEHMNRLEVLLGRLSEAMAPAGE